MEDILDHIIPNKRKMFLNFDQQLLIYIRDEEDVRKSTLINIIEMSFSLLSRMTELIISAPTCSAANGIGESIMYTTFQFNS